MKNIILLFSGSIFSSGITFFSQMILARSLTPIEFGEFNSTLSLALILAPIIGMGVDGYLLKYKASHGNGVRDYIICSLRYAVISGLITGLIFLLIFDGHKYGCLFVSIAISQFFINLCVALYQIKEKYKGVTYWLTMQSCLRFSGIIILSYYHITNVSFYYILYTLTAVILIISALFIIKKEYDSYDTSKFNLTTKQLALESAPFGVGVLFHLIYFQSDIVLINNMISSESAGIYSVAFTIISATYLLPSTIYQKYLLPRIHILSETDEEGLEKLFKKGNGLMLVAGGGIALLMFLFSSILVELLFGYEYETASDYIKCLAICIVFRYMSSNLGVFLLVDNLVSKRNLYMFITALINIIANFLFIPKFGVYGAVISTIISEMLLFILFLFGLVKYKFADTVFNDFLGLNILLVKYDK